MTKLRYQIENQRAGRKFEASQEDNIWLDKQIAKNSWGKSDRWINLDKADEWEKSREDDRRSSVDDDGLESIEIHLPDDYTIEITDITVQENGKQAAREAKKESKEACKVELGKRKDLKTVKDCKEAIAMILDYLEL